MSIPFRQRLEAHNIGLGILPRMQGSAFSQGGRRAERVVQNHLSENPFTGEVYLFRGKSGNKIKVLWATPDGMNFLYKRLNDAKFVWPQVRDGTVCLSAAQLSMLLEGIDWRHPKRTGLSPEDPDRTRPTRT